MLDASSGLIGALDLFTQRLRNKKVKENSRSLLHL